MVDCALRVHGKNLSKTTINISAPAIYPGQHNGLLAQKAQYQTGNEAVSQFAAIYPVGIGMDGISEGFDFFLSYFRSLAGTPEGFEK
jgi:hypothetical protein